MDKVEYLQSVGDLLQVAHRKAVYCFNGLVTQYVPTVTEYAAYAKAVAAVNAALNKLDESIKEVALLCLNVKD